MHTHRIRPGETLTMVAKANRTTVERLVAARLPAHRRCLDLAA